MASRPLLSILITCWSVIAAGQITGQFYLEKSSFAPGEPVLLYFQVANDGPKAENLHSADPYSFCSGYEISVSSDVTSSCAPLAVAGSCLSSYVVLRPGKKHIERLLLNFDHKIDASGEYSVKALRHLSHARADLDYFSPSIPKDTLEVSTTLYFHVDESAVPVDRKAFQPWVDQLQSTDPMKRLEAGRLLASLAPQSLEDTLLAFSDNVEFKKFAPLAFHRLNSPRSMTAMADMLKKTQSGTYEHMKSADYLAESGDPQWFPLLLEVAQKNSRISNYVDDAAELGGDKMLPTLIALAHSPDNEFTRVNAISAMGHTGSRAAVPVLVDLLKNQNSQIADRARYGLRLLTHRTASDDQSESPQSQYLKWAQWWAREGASARIYRAAECGSLTLLQ